ncbi:toll-like receptor 4 [Patella vulgata]|uniref:toll-like receptor 4 n=1 Tax=Patella vulgata TaxID=6465 RepID=UPI0024A88234|nr:toll-like receptor 4 [Patella vulgata]
MALLRRILYLAVFEVIVFDVALFQELLCNKCKCEVKGVEYIVDCSELSLKQIPSNIPENATCLILKDNLIENIPAYIFNGTNLSYLDISNNHIKSLHRFSFHGLGTLMSLDLHNNNINMEPSNYPVGVFQTFVKLQNLDISTNKVNVGSTLIYPSESFSDLKSLQTLKIDGLPSIEMGSGFSNLAKLKILNFTGHCKTAVIRNDSFINVPGLERLVLSGCQIRHIASFAFSMLYKLQFLDLSFNRNLGFEAATMPLVNLNSAAFRILNISAIVDTFAIGVEVTGLQMSRITHLNITELYLDHNRIELFDMVAPSMVPPTLKVLSMVDNRPTFGFYLLSFNGMHGIVCLYASHQYTSHIPRIGSQITNHGHQINSLHENCPYLTGDDNIKNVQTGNPNQNEGNRFENYNHISLLHWLSKNEEDRDNFVIKLPENIQYINISHSKLGYPIPRIKFAENKVKTIDLSTNILNKWHGPVLGSENLEWLSLTNNYCDEIYFDFFRGMINLHTLHIGSNFLAFDFEMDVNGSIFQPLGKLNTLDISDNKITVLPPKFLNAQVKLKHLDLSNNKMKEWALDVDHMHDLELIDLSHNSFSTLPSSLRRFGDMQHKRGKDLTINMLGQTLQCTCENVRFLKWIMTNTTQFVRRNEYKCEDIQGKMISLDNLEQVVLNLEKQCASWTVMVVVLTSSLLVVLTVLVIGLLYRFRWKLRYLYYLTRSKYRRYVAVSGAAENSFEFNAFVSYADEDRRIVVTDMIEKLEKQQGMQLCIHHRDFLVGEAIAANISNAVRNSKKTLILLTKNFLKSYWCIYELNMALMESISTGRNVVIVIIYEYIPVKDLPYELVQLMRKDSYVEYTDDPEGNIVFWDSLTKAINAD